MDQNIRPKKSNWITGMTEDVTSLLDVIGRITARRAEYDALGMSPGSGSPYELTQDDFAGNNAHLTPEILADALSSLDVLKAPLSQGHMTNLSKLRR